MKKQKCRIPTPQQLEALEKEQQKVAALQKEATVLLRQKERRDRARRTRPHVLRIILFMAAVWGILGLHHYYQHRDSGWFLVILSAIFAAGGSGYLVYCLKSRRTYVANAVWRNIREAGEWVYRDEDPFIYWCYMALLLFYDAVMIYLLLHLLIKGSV
jgi:hypothetical protein